MTKILSILQIKSAMKLNKIKGEFYEQSGK